MKINFNDEKPENIYKVGNVIRNKDDLYLIVRDIDEKYAIVNLIQNKISAKYKTLEKLIKFNAPSNDILVHAEINVLRSEEK